MMRRVCLLPALAVLVATCAIALTTRMHPALAEATGWSAPVRISPEGLFAYDPHLVTDQAGWLHAVWSANVRRLANEDLSLDTIYYARNTGDRWSAPVDIIVAPSGGQSRISRLRIDQHGRLHVLYTTWSYRPGLVYARAWADDAGMAQAWQSYALSEQAYAADVAVGMDGVVHVAYVMSNRGVYYTRSSDEGVRWSDPIPVWVTPDDQHSSGSVRMEADASGTIHVVWDITGNRDGWKPLGVSYARSTDNGSTWQNSLTLFPDDGAALPNIGFDAERGVHIVWDNPAGSQLGRGHAWSRDGGLTWGTVERVFPGYRGRTRFPVMAQDSAGTLHLVFTANLPKTGTPEALHAVWQGDRWSDPQVISAGYVGMEGPSLAVSLGNILNVIWFSYVGSEHGIWYVVGNTASPSVAPVPKETAAPSTHASAAPATATPTLAPSSAVPTGDLFSDMPPVAASWVPGAAGVMTSTLVIGAALVVRALRVRKRR